MATADLFSWLDALYTKKAIEGTPPIYVMHRFLASEQDLAPAVREIQRVIREPAMAFRIWQGLLPCGRGAPRLAYAAPKKPPAEEALIARMIQVLGERREVCEQMVEAVAAAGRAGELYVHFGIEPPKEEDSADMLTKQKKRGGKVPPVPERKGGLFAF